MNHVRCLIQRVVEQVYTYPKGAEQAVRAEFERVQRETAPEIDELKARIEKLEKMVVFAYPFSSGDMIDFADLDQTTWSAGGRPPDSVEWGVGVVECRFDCDCPDGTYSPY